MTVMANKETTCLLTYFSYLRAWYETTIILISGLLVVIMLDFLSLSNSWASRQDWYSVCKEVQFSVDTVPYGIIVRRGRSA